MIAPISYPYDNTPHHTTPTHTRTHTVIKITPSDFKELTVYGFSKQ